MRSSWLSAIAGVGIGIWMAALPGWAQPAPRDNAAASPQPGANSFSEGQARARLQSQGFDQVSPLVNDAQGIWRGTAMSGSKPVDVSVDYKGNVTAYPK